MRSCVLGWRHSDVAARDPLKGLNTEPSRLHIYLPNGLHTYRHRNEILIFILKTGHKKKLEFILGSLFHTPSLVWRARVHRERERERERERRAWWEFDRAVPDGFIICPSPNVKWTPLISTVSLHTTVFRRGSLQKQIAPEPEQWLALARVWAAQNLVEMCWKDNEEHFLQQNTTASVSRRQVKGYQDSLFLQLTRISLTSFHLRLDLPSFLFPWCPQLKFCTNYVFFQTDLRASPLRQN
jgi:hypothetical protein